MRLCHGADCSLPGSSNSSTANSSRETGIDSAAHHVSVPIVVAELIVGLLIGWLLLRRQAGHPAPMLPIDLFRRPLFALSAATAVWSDEAASVAGLVDYLVALGHRNIVRVAGMSRLDHTRVRTRAFRTSRLVTLASLSE